MASKNRIKPFSATYYNPRLFGRLGRLVCPPYDVISKSQQKRLLNRSCYNFCHVLLKKKGASYEQLGKTFRKWLEKGVLVEDPSPAFYVALQEFRIDSRRFQRRGFLGLLRLEGKRVVFPHEKTHVRPKKDRFEVIRKVRANLSPIFIIYPRKGKEPLAGIVNKLRKQSPFLKVTDVEKVTYRIWRLIEKKDIKKITSYFKKAPLLIADGHHRFEVARRFFNKNKKRAHAFQDLRYILAYFSPQDENLLILPTHRVLKKKLDMKVFFKRLAPFFVIKRQKSLKKLEDYLYRQREFCFGFFQSGDLFSLSLKERTFLDRIYANDEAYKNLDTYLLHEWIFKKLLRLSVPEDKMLYSKSLRQAKREATVCKGCGFLLKAPKITDVMNLAFKGLTLPQKTTYFYPKFLSGPILRQL